MRPGSRRRIYRHPVLCPRFWRGEEAALMTQRGEMPPAPPIRGLD